MSAIFVDRFELGDPAGASVAVKDTIDVAGRVTRCGSRIFEDAAPADRNAQVVQGLLDAGFRIVGKTNLHELAYGVTGLNDWTGTPVNPRYPALVPGGSSSGSAVAAASQPLAFAVGTDTGGSIRTPAACCGVFGLKPSFGRISRAGVWPSRSSLDSVGPLAATLQGVEVAMRAMDATFVVERLARLPALGVVPVEASASVQAAVRQALASAQARGAHLRPRSLPGFAAAYEAGLAIIAAETFATLQEHVADPRMGEDVRLRLMAAASVGPRELDAAERVRESFALEVDAALQGVDVLVLPTLPEPPPSLAVARADPRAALRMTALVRPFNLSGHPAISLPFETAEGLPCGLQLVGRRGGDAALLAVAAVLGPLTRISEPRP